MLYCKCGNPIYDDGEYCESCDPFEYIGRKFMSKQQYAITMKQYKKRMFNKIFQSLKETEKLTGGILIHGR